MYPDLCPGIYIPLSLPLTLCARVCKPLWLKLRLRPRLSRGITTSFCRTLRSPEGSALFLLRISDGGLHPVSKSGCQPQGRIISLAFSFPVFRTDPRSFPPPSPLPSFLLSSSKLDKFFIVRFRLIETREREREREKIILLQKIVEENSTRYAKSRRRDRIIHPSR